MAHYIADRVKEQASSSGMASFTLAGEMPGFLSFASALPVNGDTTWYCAVNGTEWEIGLGTRASAGVLARTTVLSSSNANALVNFTVAPTVFTTVPGSKVNYGPAFRAGPSSSAQVLTASTFTKITAQLEDFDPNSAYDTALSRFTPQVAGYYSVSGTVVFTTSVAANAMATIYKNDVKVVQGVQTDSALYALSVSGLIYLNGTTDYVELWTFSSVGRTINVLSHFEAFMARPA